MLLGQVRHAQVHDDYVIQLAYMIDEAGLLIWFGLLRKIANDQQQLTLI